jgi:hypothetical protein
MHIPDISSPSCAGSVRKRPSPHLLVSFTSVFWSIVQSDDVIHLQWFRERNLSSTLLNGRVFAYVGSHIYQQGPMSMSVTTQVDGELRPLQVQPEHLFAGQILRLVDEQRNTSHLAKHDRHSSGSHSRFARAHGHRLIQQDVS